VGGSATQHEQSGTGTALRFRRLIPAAVSPPF
jgi:hypothetical protein